MSETSIRTHQKSNSVEASAEARYDLASDITRTGQIGAWFIGRSDHPHRSWQTRPQIAVAERGREFDWVMGGRAAIKRIAEYSPAAARERR